MKKKVFLSSVLTIALCLSLIAGSTFALFTSNSEVNVAVTAGKVDVVATIANLRLSSSLENGNLLETNVFSSENTVTLDKIVPGDTVNFDLIIKNNSDVTVQYRTVIKVVTDNGLWEGLTVTIGGTTYDGVTKVADWAELRPHSADITVPVSITLSEDAGNEYQAKSCTFAYTVDAVQGNASVTNPDANTTYIYTANDLIAFANNVTAGNYYTGKTVLLMNDINLAGTAFNGIGPANIDTYGGRTFWGTFDGQNYTISNMTVSSNQPTSASVGLFNTVGESAVVKNVKLDNANVTSTRYAGGIVGYAHTGNTITIQNCHVTNSSIVSVPELVGTAYDNGDKVGGIAGYTVNTTVTGCSVSGITIGGYRDLGGIVGYANSGSAVTGNTAGNVTVALNKTHNYKNYTTLDQFDANHVVGEKDANANVSDNRTTGTFTVTEAYMVYTGADLKAALNAGGGTILVMNDITVSSDWISALKGSTGDEAVFRESIVLEGNGHTVFGLTDALVRCEANANVTIQNLTVSGANILGDTLTKTNGLGIAAFIACADAGSQITLNNCHVKDSEIIGTISDARAAGLIGYASVSNTTVTITGCSVENCTIISQANGAAGVIAFAGDIAITGCSVKGNTTITSQEDRTGDTPIAGIVIGTVAGTATIHNCTVDSRVQLTNTPDVSVECSGWVGRFIGRTVTITND